VTREGLAERLRERALLRGDFVLRSGKRSSVYLDKYRFETDPELLGPLARALAETAGETLGRVDRLAGPELGAVPLVTALGLHTGLPFLLVRSAAKEYGTSRRLEGVSAPGERILLVEDVITTGGAAVHAVEALRAEDLEVEDAVCVLDREEGGAEALHTQGVRLTALFGRAELGLDAG
jgi:orotate phosphoribosyltransferase